MKSLVTPNLKENPMDPLPQDNGNFGSIGKFVFYFFYRRNLQHGPVAFLDAKDPRVLGSGPCAWQAKFASIAHFCNFSQITSNKNTPLLKTPPFYWLLLFLLRILFIKSLKEIGVDGAVLIHS